MESGGKIARRKLSDEVLDRLLRMIQDREVEPGGDLPSERDLMQRFGVGRPAVREAMQSLAGMGIIHIAHGERARLTRMGPQTVLEQIDRSVRHLLLTSPETQEHLREARLLFEAGMVRMAARKAGAADVVKLRESLERLDAARGNVARFVAADMAFHQTIAAIAGNPIYAAVSEAMLQWVFELYPRLLRVPGTEALTLKEHSGIVEAVAAADEERAVRALTEHLTRANPLYAKAARKQQRRRTTGG